MTLSADVFVGIFLSICTCIDLIRLIFNAQLPSQFIYLHLNRQDSYISKMSLLTEKPFLSSPALKGNKTFHPIKKLSRRCDVMMLPREPNSMECLGWRVACVEKQNWMLTESAWRRRNIAHSLEIQCSKLLNVSRQMLHRWCLTIVGS